MTNTPASSEAIDNFLVTLLPTIRRNIEADSRIPWATDLTGVEVHQVPTDFMIGYALMQGFHSSVPIAAGKPIFGEHVGTRMVVTQSDIDGAIGVNLTIHDAENDSLHMSAMIVDETGTIVNHGYSDTLPSGYRLTLGDSKSSHYMTMVLSKLITDASDPEDGTGESASGTKRSICGDIIVHDYKDAFDSDLAHSVERVKATPALMPNIRDGLSKEWKFLHTNKDLELVPESAEYFKEIGTLIGGATELWHVSEDMSKLAWDTVLSDTTPDDLSNHELHSPNGIMWLDGGGGPALMTKMFPDEQFFQNGVSEQQETEILTINAIAWYTPTSKSPKYPGMVAGRTHFVGLTASPKLTSQTARWGGKLSPIDLATNTLERYRFPTFSLYNAAVVSRQIVLTVMRLAREEHIGDKREDKLTVGTKKKKKTETVTYALLRRQRYPSNVSPDSEAVEYSHRWIVRGHMRNQPVGPRNAAGEQRYERVWIAPYVKGPEDKPLVLKDRVQVWKR